MDYTQIKKTQPILDLSKSWNLELEKKWSRKVSLSRKQRSGIVILLVSGEGIEKKNFIVQGLS